ncbi:Ig-like domain-containing protein, partial [Paenibacillus sepulcri]|nr:Ig-like domain-containing protein [Paenibacillus sepulcri]
MALDAVGNGNAAATDLVRTYDHTAPAVTLTTPASNSTNQPFTVTAKFSEAVSGFADGDVAVTNGTAGTVEGSGDTYTFLISPAADGPVTVKLAGGVAIDAAGNVNTS